jgi:hypothetical protein
VPAPACRPGKVVSRKGDAARVATKRSYSASQLSSLLLWRASSCSIVSGLPGLAAPKCLLGLGAAASPSPPSMRTQAWTLAPLA